MSSEVFARGLFSAFASLVLAWAVFSRYDGEVGSDGQTSERQKYLPYIASGILPLYLLILTLAGLFRYGVADTARMLLSLCFPIFVHLSFFYLLLLLLLPLLRKYISARSCAMLWLLPNLLYLTHQRAMALPAPLWVITLPGQLVLTLFSLWFGGFAAVLLWALMDHLLFRRRVLKEAVPITEPDILSLWEELLADAGMKKCRCVLVRSPQVTTPLTLGLFRRSMRLVLPERAYTRQELTLILRHELIHIGREDARNKFFMVFCTAMCWFHPLMWVAMRKSADDLELSCDETVLLHADGEERKRYARLLLDTAGSRRGFTTCLSASADAMRYRLRSITQPVKRRAGALTMGALLFLLTMTSGYIALAYDGDTGAARIYEGNDTAAYTIRHISLTDKYNKDFAVTDASAFHAYLSALELSSLSGNYTFSDSEKNFTVLMDAPEGTLALVLYESALKIVPLYGRAQDSGTYYAADGIDWNYLDTLIFEYPAIEICLDGETNSSRMLLTKLWKTDDGERQLLHEESYPEGEYYGMFTSAPLPASAAFRSTYEPTEPLRVVVESWDKSESYTHSQREPGEEFAIQLPDYPAHYTVHAALRGKDGALYEAEFQYSIGRNDP